MDKDQPCQNDLVVASASSHVEHQDSEDEEIRKAFEDSKEEFMDRTAANRTSSPAFSYTELLDHSTEPSIIFRFGEFLGRVYYKIDKSCCLSFAVNFLFVLTVIVAVCVTAFFVRHMKKTAMEGILIGVFAVGVLAFITFHMLGRLLAKKLYQEEGEQPTEEA